MPNLKNIVQFHDPRTPVGMEVRELVATSPLSLALYSIDGKFINCSDRWRTLSPNTDDHKYTDREKAIFAAAVASCRSGKTEVLPALRVAVGAANRWVRMEMGPWRNAAGEVAYLIAHGWEVTEEEQARRAVLSSEARLNAALGIDRLVVNQFNLKTGENLVSGDCEDLKALMLRFNLDITHVHPDDRAGLKLALDRHIAERRTEPLYAEYRLDTVPDLWVSTKSQLYLDADGAGDTVLLVSQDITERKRTLMEIEALAFSDALTGLPNRARFNRDFEAAVAEAERTGASLGLVMIDVDHFKDVNDTLGHDAGDALLKELADQLRQAFRHDDLVARLGGDEFAILLRDVANEADMQRPLAALRAALTIPLHYRGQGFRISTSIGAALHDDPWADATHLLKNADIALYKAKQAGRDCVVIFQPEMRSDLERRLELLRDVRAAIPRDEFVLFYQPVVSVGANRVAGLEALMRWNHPDHGILPPAYFMAAFEDEVLSKQLGDIAVETALQQMRAWIDQDVAFGRVAINLSSAQFRTGRLAEHLLERLQHWGVPPDRLTVEVTESVYLGWGAEIVGETVRTLHESGVTIALDDFGTGYASLANLRQFPIDRLKIDKSFVQNEDDDAIVRAVINLGASMGMEVVAEGVERSDQLATVTGYGCDQVQGYHFARPMPANEVSAYLAAFAAAAEASSVS
jgi:diguanylate cyclase (GGDEF)-like protein